MSILWMHSWLFNLHVTIPIFFMFFIIFANGAMQSPWALFCNLFWYYCDMGDYCYLGGASFLICGCRYRCRGNWSSFLFSNRFSEADPVLRQWVPYLTGALGMSSSGGGLEVCPSFWGLAVGFGTSANCSIANLYTITSIDVAVDLVTGIWVEALATVGVGAVGVVVVGVCWASTLTLSLLLVSTVLFLLSLALGPGPFLVMGLDIWWGIFVLGCGWVWVWDQAFPLIPNTFSSFGWGRGKDGTLCSMCCTWWFAMFCPFRTCQCLA